MTDVKLAVLRGIALAVFVVLLAAASRWIRGK